MRRKGTIVFAIVFTAFFLLRALPAFCEEISLTEKAGSVPCGEDVLCDQHPMSSDDMEVTIEDARPIGSTKFDNVNGNGSDLPNQGSLEEEEAFAPESEDLPDSAASDVIEVGSTDSVSEFDGDLQTTASSVRDKLDYLAGLHRDDLPDGTYYISSCGSQSLFLGAADGGEAAGSEVSVSAFTGINNQIWRVSHDEKGYLTVINCQSNLALDVLNGISDPGSTVQLWDQNSSYAQKWIAITQEDGSRIFLSALDENVALDVRNGSFYDSAQIQIFTCNYSVAQRWNLTPAKTVQERIKNLAALHVFSRLCKTRLPADGQSRHRPFQRA